MSTVEQLKREGRLGVASDTPPAYGAHTVDTDVPTSEYNILVQAYAILNRAVERGPAMSDPTAAGNYCKLQFFTHLELDPEREHFGCLFLDNRHRSLGFEVLFHGTVDGAEIHVREIAKRALALNAAAVIVCHNHPSGNTEPSAADRAITARLKQSLAMLDIRLLDHFVLADGPPVSLAARGWV